MQTKQRDTPVSNPSLYEHVYKTYRSYIFRMVRLCGVPANEVDDSVSNIIVRMLAQDGMAKFEGEPTLDRIRRFVASYFRLGARNEQERSLTYRGRFELVGHSHEYFDCPSSVYAPGSDTLWDDLFEVAVDLLDQGEADAAFFIEACAEHQSYRLVRKTLLDEGWESVRIRRAVITARTAVKAYLCTKS
jgi:hypothetical protein